MAAVKETPDGYFAATGYSYSNDVDLTNNLGGADFWLVKLGACSFPDVPGLSASVALCNGDTTTLHVISGNLHDAADWIWYDDFCGGDIAGTGTSLFISPESNRTYYVRGEGGCVTPNTCASVTVTINPLEPPTISSNGSTTLCGNDTIHLSVPSGNALQFDGIVGGASGFIVTVTDAQVLAVTHPPSPRT